MIVKERLHYHYLLKPGIIATVLEVFDSKIVGVGQKVTFGYMVGHKPILACCTLSEFKRDFKPVEEDCD